VYVKDKPKDLEIHWAKQDKHKKKINEIILFKMPPFINVILIKDYYF
jgi:hypothetical protein